MLIHVLSLSALIIAGFLLVLFIYKRSSGPENLNIRRTVSIALLVFLFADGIISGDNSKSYFPSVLACIVFSQLFMRKRSVS